MSTAEERLLDALFPQESTVDRYGWHVTMWRSRLIPPDRAVVDVIDHAGKSLDPTVVLEGRCPACMGSLQPPVWWFVDSGESELRELVPGDDDHTLALAWCEPCNFCWGADVLDGVLTVLFNPVGRDGLLTAAYTRRLVTPS